MAGGVAVLIEVYKIKEIKAETRIKILKTMGDALDYEFGANWTEPLVSELVELIKQQESR